MSQPARSATLRRFAEDDSLRVLLLSLRAGGVGLNLVSAQSVYLLDPWWNPAVEEQAIDRVHRIGQAHPVHLSPSPAPPRDLRYDLATTSPRLRLGLAAGARGA